MCLSPCDLNSQHYEQIIAQILVKNKDYDYFCKTKMMMMKKYVVKIVVLVAVIVFAACSTLTPAQKAERRAKVEQAVNQALEEREYKIDIDMMYPRSGQARNVTSDYSLQVKGDSVYSYLPYFGRAYNIPYGGGKGLNFKSPITNYKSEKDQKGTTFIYFNVNNEEDYMEFKLEVFDNGNASIDLTPREREPISFSGKLDLVHTQ